MAILEKIDFIRLPNVRIIGCEVGHTLRPGADNPVPSLWKRILENGTVSMLKGLLLAVPNCTIGWIGDVSGQDFRYIAGVIAVKDTPVPQGMQHRDIPACRIANGYVYGNLQNGDVYSSAYELTVTGIREHDFMPDDSFGWSAEIYLDNVDFSKENGVLCYYQPYK